MELLVRCSPNPLQIQPDWIKLKEKYDTSCKQPGVEPLRGKNDGFNKIKSVLQDKTKDTVSLLLCISASKGTLAFREMGKIEGSNGVSTSGRYILSPNILFIYLFLGLFVCHIYATLSPKYTFIYELCHHVLHIHSLQRETF